MTLADIGLTPDELIEREWEGSPFGPYWRAKYLERAPEKVRRDLELARRFPHLRMARQGFASMDVNDVNPASFTAIATTVTETNLWNPAIWTPIPANDMRAGKVYKVSCGGIISTTVTPTIQWRAAVGQNNSVPPTNLSLGLSTAVATGSGLASVPWYAEFVMGVRSLGIAASGATVTGNGFAVTGGIAAASSQVAGFGGTVATTADNTAASGLVISFIWGTSSASNTITCQWVVLRSYN